MTTVRLANTTDRDLVLRNVELHVPALSSPDLHRLSTFALDFARQPLDMPARLRDVRDTGAGSATLSVELTLPTGTGCWLTAEAP